MVNSAGCGHTAEVPRVNGRERVSELAEIFVIPELMGDKIRRILASTDIPITDPLRRA